MATSYKYLTSNDRVVVSSPLVEAYQITPNTKALSSSLYYVSAHTSSTSNPVLFNVTFGRSQDSEIIANPTEPQKEEINKKEQIYYQMGKVLLGYDDTGAVRLFNTDKDSVDTTDILHNAFFLNIPRNSFKDYIKPGTFKTVIKARGPDQVTLCDLTNSSGADEVTYLNAQTGRVGVLYASGSTTTFNITPANEVQGYIFYEAGLAVISPYIFAKSGSANPTGVGIEKSGSYIGLNPHGILKIGVIDASFSGSSGDDIGELTVSGSIKDLAVGFANRVESIAFDSTTELNSTVYFCRAFNNEFNYSSNPTYLSGSEIRVKDGEPTNPPVSYITTVGLYSDDNQLLAVAKLSEPIKKTPETELIARVRLDF